MTTDDKALLAQLRSGGFENIMREAAASRIEALAAERDELDRVNRAALGVVRGQMKAVEESAAERNVLRARVDVLSAALTSASEVIDAMVIQFRNRDQQPPEPQLIQAGKIVLAAVCSALSAKSEGETLTGRQKFVADWKPVADAIKSAVRGELNDLVKCIRATTWSGTEEIVEMIVRRAADISDPRS